VIASKVEIMVTAFSYRLFFLFIYLFTCLCLWTTDALYGWLSIKLGFGKYLEVKIAAQFDAKSLSLFTRKNMIADEIRNHHVQIASQVPYSLGEFSRPHRHYGL
jgi:hypothetical protein